MKTFTTLTLTAGLMLALQMPAQATLLFTSGFESPTYAVGQLAGQSGWANSGVATVQTGVVASGTQALEVRTAGVAGQSINAHQIAYDSVGNAEQHVRFSVDFMLAGLSAQFAALDTFAVFGNAGFVSQQLVVGTNGQTCTVTPCSGPLLDVGTWYRMALDLDFATSTASHYIDGVLFSSGAFYSASTSLGSVGLGINNSLASSNMTAYFDNLRIESIGQAVPEPGSLALAGIALIALGAARKAKKAQ